MWHNRTGFTLVEIVLVVVALAAIGFAGWTWWQTSGENESVEIDSAANEQEEPAQDGADESGSPIFEAKELKVGDQVGAMEVVSVEKASDQAGQELSDNNVSVVFKGEVAVSGTYVERTGLQEGACLENLDDASRNKLPRVEDDERSNFCFSNGDEAETRLEGNQDQQVTVVVDDYNYVYYPSEVTNTARLVEVE